MGRNKALLPLVDGGPPLLEMVLSRLRDVATEVFLVANDPAPYARFGVRTIPDLEPGGGALGGIQAAIAGSTYEHCLVVACDMPFLNADLLRRMADEPRDYDVLVPRLPGESRQGRGQVFQTLHAIYGKGCGEAIAKRIVAGDRRVIGFFDDVRVRTLDETEVRKWDPELRSFYNANTPEALAQAALVIAEAERKPRR